MGQQIIQQSTCFHCGEQCGNHPVIAQQKPFCCQGCKMVFEILNQNGLCDYYELTKNPGSKRQIEVRQDKFAFLDDKKIAQSLISYADDVQTHVRFYLPQIHCSSCLWLLENLHRLNEQVISSKVNFPRKEAETVFTNQNISLRQVAELLTSIGYEPYISFNDMNRQPPRINRSKIFKLGVAAFCFANIMLLSFPEYLGIGVTDQKLITMFRYLSLVLSLPVFFYSASEFYISAWKSLKHKFLNIDAPVVLAIWVTFGRSLYEVFTSTGGGYFDSMTGIVFFMLIGRVLQDKTYQQLSFERDYTSYFPIAVTRLHAYNKETVALPDIKLNDSLLIHNQELIPADGILTRGSALIDYSFVTGESIPVQKEMGEIVYAGGKQMSGNIEILVIKEVAQSYLTSLWNRNELKQQKDNGRKSFVHLMSRYFTWFVFAIAITAAVYWAVNDSTKIWSSVTAVLIIACPCALLLSNTFTNGNILRVLSRNKFYLRNAQAIEDLSNIDHIVFDKTGTLTTGERMDVEYKGEVLTPNQERNISTLAAQSNHPLSKAIANFLGDTKQDTTICFSEKPGQGIEGLVNGELIALGSKKYVKAGKLNNEETAVYVSVEEKVLGKFVFKNHYRDQVPSMIESLQKKYAIALLSGDSGGELSFLQTILKKGSRILFHQQPEDKLDMITHLQSEGRKVLMIGDGLNDAGALKQANVGIAVTDNTNNFTPASDAIIQAGNLYLLPKFIKLCKINKRIVLASFIVSIAYNLVGILFAVQGSLSPMIAAILMPASSLTILLITFGSSNVAAWKLGLR